MTKPAHLAVRCIAAVWLLGALPGCQMPAASLQLLDGLDTALSNVSGGNQAVRDSIVKQLKSQQDSLDAAFEFDLRNLAASSPARTPTATAPADEPAVRLADVLAAKRLYDLKRVDLAASRVNVTDTFDRLDNNLAASRQMVDMLRRLVLQQNVLSGQADLAVHALLAARKSTAPAATPK